jgi:hypothetical protein
MILKSQKHRVITKIQAALSRYTVDAVLNLAVLVCNQTIAIIATGENRWITTNTS